MALIDAERAAACADLAIAWAVKVEHAAIVAIAATAGDTMAVAGAVAPVGGKTSLRPEKTGHFQSLAISTNNTRGMLEILQPHPCMTHPQAAQSLTVQVRRVGLGGRGGSGCPRCS